MTLDDVRAHLAEYDGIPAERLRAHLVDFLAEVAPLAESLGLRLCCHPDDPPFPLLGLPRMMSTEADYAAVLRGGGPAGERHHPVLRLARAPAPDNDLPGMMRRLGDRVHFLHLRNVRRETDSRRPARSTRTSI